MIPVVLVGLLGLLAISAAVVGLLGSPSSDQISLQSAAAKTAEAQSFSYTIGEQIESVGPRQRPIPLEIHGIWRAPNQWQVTNLADGGGSTTTITGSTLHVSYGHSPSLVLQLSSSDLTESMTDPSSPVLSLPPLGLLFTATNIKRTGDTYSFVIPLLNIGVSGWIAYAPLSHATVPLMLTQALNTRADVVVENGYVTSFGFPDGIRPLRGGAFRDVEWHISDVGDASLQRVANSG
jgi:hypothetical protein